MLAPDPLLSRWGGQGKASSWHKMLMTLGKRIAASDAVRNAGYDDQLSPNDSKKSFMRAKKPLD